MSARIPTLDGWRGIAILLVLVGHFSPLSAWARSLGHHGVAIFFVLSGFLITTLLTEEKQRAGTIDLRRFYIRRLFRLMPCAWSYLAIILLISIHIKPFAAPQEFLGCIFFFRNYLDFGSAHTITGHFWSLSVEEQFYLFWPLALLLNRRTALLLAVAGSLIVAGWRLEHWASVNPRPIMFWTVTQYQADALLAGCAVALALPALRKYLRAWMALPLLAFLVACASRYPELIPLHESVAIAVLLAITTQCQALSILDWKPLALLGTASYSLYVWQQPFWLLAVHGYPMLPCLIVLAIVTLGSYYWIERPCTRFGHQLTSKDRGHARGWRGNRDTECLAASEA